VVTDVVLLQRANVGFEYIAAPINQLGADLLSLSDVVRAKIIQEYGQETNFESGSDLMELERFVRGCLRLWSQTVILDWYHLCKKLRQLMSMIAVDKVENSLTWSSNFSTLAGPGNCCLDYLRTQVRVRNPEKWSELIGYLEKHQSEIINYNRRRLVGKTIGSGRMEKGVDLDVVRRRKLWVGDPGSKALSLRIVELNERWQQLWFPAQAS